MLGLIGKKIGMTSAYDVQGHHVPCTVIASKGCVVTQIKTIKVDGYEAVQLGYGEKKTKNTPKPLQGHYKQANTTPKHQLVEFRNFVKDFPQALTLGQTIHLKDIFSEGHYVDIVGHAKGRGFQGVVKRYNFKGVGQATHGQHNRLRAPGSIGGCSYPARVFKGMRMAGRMGGQRVKMGNLKILQVIPEKNLLIVQGAVPGANNSYLLIQQ